MREQAEIKKQMEAEATALNNQRKEYQNKLDEIAKNFQSQQLKRPPADLLQTDPIKYMMETEKYNIAKEDMERLQAERQKLAIEQNEKAEQERLAYLQKQGQALVEYIPDLKDTAKAEGIKKEMIKTAVQYGFSESDISSIQDARALKLLHDVMLFNKAKSSKNTNVKKSDPRPFIKAGARKSPNAVSSKERDKAFQKMKETGSVQDVARWLITPEKR
jgi:multidrug efflux pump subunit AcrB